MKAESWLLLFVVQVLVACGPKAAAVRVLSGDEVELGAVPEGQEDVGYSLAADGDGIRILEIREQSVVLGGWDPGGGEAEPEVLLNIQPELWEMDADLVAGARKQAVFEELSPLQLDTCLREGLVDMSQYLRLYEQGLVRVGGGWGIVFGARVRLVCEDVGISTLASVEHVIVFDESWNRIQHDRHLWLGEPPMEAMALEEVGTAVAAWLAPRGVWVAGGGTDCVRAVKFVDPWSTMSPPAHLFVPAGGDALFALGTIQTPMATVGQGGSYLVLHVADRDDPTHQQVERISLPDDPQFVAGAWSGDGLGVVLFTEIRKPHTTSFAKLYFLEVDANARLVDEVRTVFEWEDPMGASFGLMELAMGGTGGEWTTAYLYDQGLGPVVEVVEHGPGGSGPRAGHDIGRGKVEDLRVVHSEAGHYILWSDSALRLFH